MPRTVVNRKELNGGDDENVVFETEDIKEKKEGSDGKGHEMVREGADGSDNTPEIEDEAQDPEVIAKEQAERSVLSSACFESRVRVTTSQDI